jgi:(p)ppGpp synthase/HD superfamily hydrolase
MLEAAREFALEAHGDQKWGDKPYSYHLDGVVDILSDFVDPHLPNMEPSSRAEAQWLKAVGYLHDTIEDTEVTFLDLKREFTTSVALGVFALTNESGENRKEKFAKTYPKIKANPIAYVVKLADRIFNMRKGINGYKTHGNTIVQMYVKEYESFRENLFEASNWFSHDTNAITSNMWVELDRLYEEAKSLNV